MVITRKVDARRIAWSPMLAQKNAAAPCPWIYCPALAPMTRHMPRPWGPPVLYRCQFECRL